MGRFYNKGGELREGWKKLPKLKCFAEKETFQQGACVEQGPCKKVEIKKTH